MAQHKVDFEKVYNQHYHTIFNYCLRRTGDFDVSRDITSETFLKAYLNLPKFEWKGIPILNWLYRIASNEIKLFFRTKQYQARLVQNIYMDNLVQNQALISMERQKAQEEMERHQKFLKVQKVVQQLPEKYQEIISLKYFEQLTIKEIAVILKKKEGTVKSLLSRGLKRLRDKM